MNDEIHRYLDGELPLEALSPANRKDALAWRAMAEDLESAAPATAPPELVDRVMQTLPEPPAEPPSLWHGLKSWLLEPRVPALGAGMAVAAAAAFVWLWVDGSSPPAPPAAPETTPSQVFVQFALEAPEATSVALAGDFNDWSPQPLQPAPGQPGVWTSRVALPPGVHTYMYLVDGHEWVADPHAQRYTDDGFGNANAQLVVTAPDGA